MQINGEHLVVNDQESLTLNCNSHSNKSLYEVKKFTKSELEYWGKGITEKDLKIHDICSLSFYEDHIATEDNFLFGIFTKGELTKVIFPQEKISHSLSVNNDQLIGVGYNYISERKITHLIITSNDRDVVNLQKAGLYAICFNCELAEIPREIISKLIFKSKYLYVSVGLDGKSRDEANKLLKQYPFIKNINLPDTLRHLKINETQNSAESVTDFFRFYTRNDYDSLMDKTILLSSEIIVKEKDKFWAEKKLKNGAIRYKFLPSRISSFLASNGIFEYGFNDSKPSLIKITNCWVESISIRYVQKLLLIVSKEYGNEDIMNEMIVSLRLYSDKKLLSLIDSKRELEFYTGRLNSQMLLFKGRVINVSKDGIKDLKLSSVQNYIWKDHEIDFLPNIEKEYYQIYKDRSGVDINIVDDSCDFLKYLKNTSSIYHAESTKTPDMIAEEKLHLVSKLTIIGYLLHDYVKKSERLLILAYDYSSLFSNQADGGTGKSILGTALSQMVPTEEFDGMDRQLTKKDTGFSRVTDKTKLIFIDDVRSDFDLKDLFAKITGRFSVRNLFQDSRILAEDQPLKFFGTSNKFFDLIGKSKDRRVEGTYFSDYYEHKRKTPASEFGYEFFSIYEPYEQRNKFYNLMIQCIISYLKFGLIKAKIPDTKIRVVRNKIGEDYLEWADEFFELYDFGERICRSEFDDSFLNYISKIDAKKYSKRQLKDKLKLYCELKGYDLNPELNGGIIRSNSKEYYRIVRKENQGSEKSK